MRESHVSEGCSIEGTVENSIIFPNVTIKKGAVVRHSVVMSSTTVEENAEVHYAIIAEGVTVGAKAEIGANPEKDVIPAISVVADRVNISCGTRIDAGTVVDRDL